jgi:hypothetical protein
MQKTISRESIMREKCSVNDAFKCHLVLFNERNRISNLSDSTQGHILEYTVSKEIMMQSRTPCAPEILTTLAPAQLKN